MYDDVRCATFLPLEWEQVAKCVDAAGSAKRSGMNRRILDKTRTGRGSTRMMRMRATVFGMMVFGVMSVATTVAASAQTPADVVLMNGKVLTVDAADRIAQAIAVRGDKIVAVGRDEDIQPLIGPRTRRIDLHGRTVTPGLLDAHNHFSGGGADRLFVLDLSYPNVKSIADVQAAIAEQVKKLPPGSWVEGRGWDEGKLAERRLISARDLDVVSPNNPVYLTQTTGH